MTIYLKQSTASQEIPLGYFLDSTDGDTGETALSIANTDIKLWKNGATTLANKNSGGATHISGGIYYAVLDATDTNTLGPMVIFVHVSGALAVRLECMVLPALSYAAMITNGFNDVAVKADTAAILTDTGTTLETHLTDIKGATFSGATDSLEAIRDRGDTAWITGAGGSAPTAATIADAVWDEALSGHTTAGSYGKAVADIETDATAILADTNELQGDWVNGGRLDNILDARAAEASLPTNFSTLVISGAGRVDALVQGFLDNLITETTAGRIAANFDTFFENADAATSAVVDDVGGATALTQQQVADALKLAPTAGTPAAGSVNAHLDELIVDTDTTIPALINGLNDFDPSNDAVANVTLVGTCTTNTDMRGTDSAFLAANAPTNFADLAITSSTGKVTVGTNDDKTGYSISGSVTTLDGLNNISAADVNAQVVDVIRTDTVAEVAGVPSANAALSAKINFLFALARNKSTQTSTTFTLRNDADGADIGSQTVSDNGTTFIRGEMS